MAISLRVGKSVFLKFFHAPDIIIVIGILSFMAIGPLLFFNIRFLLQPDFKFQKGYIIHVVIIAFFGISYFFWPPFRSSTDVIRYYSIVLYLSVYILCAWLIFRRERKHSQDDDRAFLFKWARILMAGVSVIWGAYYLSLTVSRYFYVVGPVLWSFVFFIMIFWIFNQGNFQKSWEQKKKYQHSTLMESDAQLYYQNLLKIVSDENLYLDPNLTLVKLAKRLSILPLHLSQIINERCRQNFADFINSYRLEEAKGKLSSKEYEHLTIASIARECGFNSISSFNTAFKKKYHITPSRFRPDPD